MWVYGNPGKEYEKTRHNAGFIVVDEMAKMANIDINKNKFDALVGEYMHNGEKIMLVKPQTYMNLSGESIRQIVDFYKVDLEDLIVIYDDIDIELGKIRIRPSGSPGTHNGMRNITELLGSDKFPRVRMGTSRPPEYMDLKDFVLAKMSDEEWKIFDVAVKNAVKSIEEILANGVRSAMNLYNSNGVVK